MVTAATRGAFEKMAGAGHGDAGALALGLRHGVTGVGLRALAAKAAHVAAAAPDRMADIYDNAAAGWLGGAVFPPRVRNPEAFAISDGWWAAFWTMTRGTGRKQQSYAATMMQLVAELDPGISLRMAEAALEYPGVAEAAMGKPPAPLDVEALGKLPPASLGYAVSQEMRRPDGLMDPYWSAAVPYLRHMPAPLAYINITVIQSMALWGLAAGYSSRTLDRVGLGGFLMGQVGHHYSALASAVTLTSIALKRPDNVEVILDCVFRGWQHGRETRPLIGVNWDDLWPMRIDEVRAALKIAPFASPYAAAARAAARTAARP